MTEKQAATHPLVNMSDSRNYVAKIRTDVLAIRDGKLYLGVFATFRTNGTISLGMMMLPRCLIWGLGRGPYLIERKLRWWTAHALEGNSRSGLFPFPLRRPTFAGS